MYFQPYLLPNEPTSDRFLTTDGQHDFAIQTSVWHVLPASSPYLDTSERIGLQGIGLLDCWP